MVSIAGLDALAFMGEQDPLRRSAMLAIAREVWRLNQLLDQSRAIIQANKIGELFR